MFDEKKKLMDFGYFPGDLRRKSSFSDLGFGGFRQTSSSSSERFRFSGDRTTPPIINPFMNLDTTAFMADGGDLGLSQNLSRMLISDERSSFLTPVLRNLHGQAQAREGLVQSGSSMRGYGGFREEDLRVRREGFIKRFHGESSMNGYVGDGGDYHRLRLLGLQEAYNPNPSFNLNARGFTENLSLRNRGYMFEPTNQQIRRDIVPPLMYSGNRNVVPPFSSAMRGSRELEASAMSMMMKNSSFDCNGNEMKKDLALNLESMVDIYGSVYLMTKDQLGCRILQKIIEEGSFVDVMIVFKEVINHVTELTMDPFGNYFIQKLLDVSNEEQRTQILVRLTSKPGLLVKISINTYGTRVVQKLIETVSTKEQISFVKSALIPGFLSLVRELNGNHVILSCLKSFSPNDNKFILEAATKFCVEIATHRHGCCVLQRCVSYSVGDQHEKLVGEISKNSLHLAQDPFGNYVLQYIIEKKVGGVNVMFELRGNYVKLAKQKFGSHVVEKCLRFYPESRSQIVHELVSVPNFEHLLQDPYANYVIQSALSKTKGYVRASLVEKVQRCESLRMSPYCKKIFSKSLLKK